MPTSQVRIDERTPLGANAVPGGCTFRAWAPRAKAVYISFMATNWRHEEPDRLVRDAQGCWGGFVPGVAAGAEYRFYIEGEGSSGFKRDPYARELTPDANHLAAGCIVRDPASFPWHDAGFHPPAFEDLVIYQFHIGRFFAVDRDGRDRRPGRVATYLDVIDRIEYLVELGVNAIQPLPIVEFPHDHSLGYNGVDYFSPEMAYGARPEELEAARVKINALLAARGQPPLALAQLASQVGQFKTMIDLCHVYGIAVILDVVYNHAGGEFGDESLYFFDRFHDRDQNNSLYFTDQGWAGGLVFAYWNQGVRRFLIENARFWLEEYHVDGFRYDEVTVIDDHGGWSFCQELTAAVRDARPSAVQIAEYWRDDKSWVVRSADESGAGFDLVWSDGLRGAVRNALAQAAGGRDAHVDLDAVARNLYPPHGIAEGWRAVNHLENHDLLWANHDAGNQQPRIPALADASDHRSWYARSRSRWATGLLFTAPGVPMLFMGQDFLEDKLWTDDGNDRDHLIWWDGLKTDRAMSDFLRFTRELIALRKRTPALRRGSVNVFHVHNHNRVLAFHRWIDGVGRDVVVVANLNESTWWGYQIGFPQSGWWREVFNSDVYDHWVNPQVAGNGDGVHANGPPMHGLPASALVVIPANGFVVFARE